MTRDQQPTLTALGLAIRARVPVLLWGLPGTGKTSCVRSLSSLLGLPCEVVIASIHEPSDFAGLPILVEDRVRYAPPSWALNLREAGKGVLFLDEISTAPPAVQASLLRVVLERTVGDLELPEEVSIVAAANQPDTSAGGWILTAPLANRFCHLDWIVNSREVGRGLSAGFDDPWIPNLSPESPVHTQRLLGQIGAFLSIRPDLAASMPESAWSAGRAWPSPRTWEMAAKLAGAAVSSGCDSEVEAILITGCVGEGAALEFLEWKTNLDLPDPEDLLANPAAHEFPDRPDRLYAVLMSVALAVSRTNTLDRWQAAWRVLARSAGSSPDVAVAAARILMENRPHGAQTPDEVKVFIPLLRSAGLV